MPQESFVARLFPAPAQSTAKGCLVYLKNAALLPYTLAKREVPYYALMKL